MRTTTCDLPRKLPSRHITTFSLFLATALLSLSAARAAPGENLLRNAQFAPRDDAPLPADWRIGSGPQTVRLDAETPPEGAQRTLRVDIQGKASSWGEATQGLTGLKPTATYRLSGLVRSTKNRLGVLQVKLYRNRRELKRIASRRSDTEWKTLSVEFVPGEADKIEVLCRWTRDKEEAIGQTVWFANVQLVELPPPRLVKVSAVPTFHSAGVTVDYEGGAGKADRCTLQYRREEDTEWRAAMDLVLYPPDRQFRGSLFHLQPDTKYQVRCRLKSAAAPQPTPSPVETTVRTWCERVPIAEVRRLPAGTTEKPLVVNLQGSADGWILLTGPEQGTATVDVGTSSDHAVLIEKAAFVILDNLVLRGGTKDCVRVSDSHHVRIRRCDIADWGDAGTRRDDLKMGLYVDARGRLINYQAGVRLSAKTSQVVVEDNFIHHPRGTANSWKYGHPAGPQGVIIANPGGNNVVRNNDIIGSEDHWWNDAIESIANASPEGGPYRDTDIDGNVLAFSNDDGTELDGGQINVRFWNNWIDKALCGVSCAPNRRGPSYVYRNLIVLTGEEYFRTGAGFKMGGDRYPDPGLSLLLHNTVYSNNHGLTSGHFGRGPTPIVTRNNLFTGPGDRDGGIRYRHVAGGDFDYDLIPPGGATIEAPGREAHAVVGRPKFRDAAAGDFRLLEGSPGIDAGQALPGLNDNADGDGPDMGAFEHGLDEPPVFPIRSLALSAVPLRNLVDYHLGAGQGGATVTLLAQPSTGTRWTAHPNSPWIRCEPSAGPCSNEPQTVRVTMTPGNHPIRLHRGAVTFRTDRGLNRTVMVDFRVFPSNYQSVSLEAESATVSGRMRTVQDDTASGGAYVDTPEEVEGALRFSFHVRSPGTYYIFGRCCVPGPPEKAANQDSFEISLDEGKRLRWDIPHRSPDRWIVCPAGGFRNPGDPFGFQLEAGQHTLTIHAREPLARLDRLVITNAPYPPPADQGPQPSAAPGTQPED